MPHTRGGVRDSRKLDRKGFEDMVRAWGAEGKRRSPPMPRPDSGGKVFVGTWHPDLVNPISGGVDRNLYLPQTYSDDEGNPGCYGPKVRAVKVRGCFESQEGWAPEPPSGSFWCLCSIQPGGIPWLPFPGVEFMLTPRPVGRPISGEPKFWVLTKNVGRERWPGILLKG